MQLDLLEQISFENEGIIALVDLEELDEITQVSLGSDGIMSVVPVYKENYNAVS
jgi:hypothetical protein